MTPVRSAALALVLLLTTEGCVTDGHPDPPSARTASYAAGLDVIAARETVVAFLTAYAESGGGTRDLAALVAGPSLRDWVRWLHIQNSGLGPALAGRTSVRGLRIVSLSPDAAVASVDATVTLTLETDGETTVSDRVFQSPVILVRTGKGPGSWAILDVSRDGRSMVDSIAVIDPPARRSRNRIRLEVVSVYRFTSGTAVNLRLHNRGSRPLQIDRRATLLQASGRLLQASGASPSLRDSVEPGTTVEGAVNFGTVPTTFVPELLTLNLGHSSITVRLPTEAFLMDTG